MTHPQDTTSEVVARLLTGVVDVGMHDDNSTELFDVDGANDTMADAAALISSLVAERDEAGREAQAWADNALREVGELRVLGENWKARATTAETQLAALTAERDEAMALVNYAEARAKVAEDELDACIEAAKQSWAKHGGMEMAKGQWKARAETAEARVAVLEKALEQYADETNWRMRGRFNPEHSQFDGITFARTALEPKP